MSSFNPFWVYDSANPDGYVIEAGLGTFWNNNRLSIKPPTIELDGQNNEFVSYGVNSANNVKLSNLATVTRIKNCTNNVYRVVFLDGAGRMRDGEFIFIF